MGFKAKTACVNTRVLDASWAGRTFDGQFLDELPVKVDPCGENGEFHTFVYDGPGFQHPVGIRGGEVIERDGFSFCDLLPA
jgi:diphthamide synthase (EF-2-diphthine--ammonia ligase)